LTICEIPGSRNDFITSVKLNWKVLEDKNINCTKREFLPVFLKMMRDMKMEEKEI